MYIYIPGIYYNRVGHRRMRDMYVGKTRKIVTSSYVGSSFCQKGSEVYHALCILHTICGGRSLNFGASHGQEKHAAWPVARFHIVVAGTMVEVVGTVGFC